MGKTIQAKNNASTYQFNFLGEQKCICMKQTPHSIRYQQHKYLSHQISTKQTPQSSTIKTLRHLISMLLE